MRKDDQCYKLAENLADFCSSVGWKVVLVSNEFGYLAKISKQSVKTAAQFLLTAYYKMQEGKDILKKEILSKSYQHLMIWTILNLSREQKMQKGPLQRTPMVTNIW